MKSEQNEQATPITPPPASTALRWEGHMSDGVGCTYGLEPLAHLTADPEHLTLAGNRGNFRLPRAAITRLGRGGFYPWFFGGIRIRHTVANFPDELVFKPMNVRERDILSRLRELGYPSG
ncbi:MAG: hypothetical protein ACKOTE_01015 [Opitutaceae bacterium]